jgi:hypothetical protein
VKIARSARNSKERSFGSLPSTSPALKRSYVKVGDSWIAPAELC